jgi:hypothetical protein
LAIRLGPEAVTLIQSIRPNGHLVTVLDEPVGERFPDNARSDDADLAAHVFTSQRPRLYQGSEAQL